MVSSDAGIACVSNSLMLLSRSVAGIMDDGAAAADADATWGDSSDEWLAAAADDTFATELELN